MNDTPAIASSLTKIPPLPVAVVAGSNVVCIVGARGRGRTCLARALAAAAFPTLPVVESASAVALEAVLANQRIDVVPRVVVHDVLDTASSDYVLDAVTTSRHHDLRVILIIETVRQLPPRVRDNVDLVVYLPHNCQGSPRDVQQWTFRAMLLKEREFAAACKTIQRDRYRAVVGLPHVGDAIFWCSSEMFEASVASCDAPDPETSTAVPVSSDVPDPETSTTATSQKRLRDDEDGSGSGDGTDTESDADSSPSSEPPAKRACVTVTVDADHAVHVTAGDVAVTIRRT
jgi:hypothetical protein